MLHASFRTQSKALIEDANAFFGTWAAAEQAHGLCGKEDFTIEDGTWNRVFRMRAESHVSSEELGEAIGQYIKKVDAALKAYFSALPDKEAAERAVAGFFPT